MTRIILKEWRGIIENARKRGYFDDSDYLAIRNPFKCAVTEAGKLLGIKNKPYGTTKIKFPIVERLEIILLEITRLYKTETKLALDAVKLLEEVVST